MKLTKSLLAVDSDDDEDAETETVLAELEQIDDECDSKGIQFVKIDSLAEAKKYGIDDVPALVYFEDGVPALYEGSDRCWIVLSAPPDLLNAQVI